MKAGNFNAESAEARRRKNESANGGHGDTAPTPIPFQRLLDTYIREATLRRGRERNDLVREHLVYYMGPGAPTNDHDLARASLDQGFYFEEFIMADGTSSLCITRDGVPLVVELLAETKDRRYGDAESLWY